MDKIAPWYFILIYIVLGSFLLWIFDKYRIIKSKRLRYFLVIFIFAFLYWGCYDLFIAPML